MGNKVTPKVRLIWHSPEPQKTVALCARMCYSAMPVSELQEKLTQEEIDRMVQHILRVRHVSVLRHVIFAFTIEGVSRSFSHQFVRHHVGVDVEQRSTHYRREKDFDFEVPEAVSKDKDANDFYLWHMEDCQELYDKLISIGIDKSEARQVLPHALETQMVVTMNLNAIMNVVSQRACRLNTPEILAVAVQIRKLVTQVIPEAGPFIGPTCFSTGICYESDKYYAKCNMPWKTPCVLFRPDFPRRIELIGVGNKKGEIRTPENWTTSDGTPDEQFMLSQKNDSDSKNQS